MLASAPHGSLSGRQWFARPAFHPWMPSFSGGTELPVIVVTVLYVQKKGVDALIHREERGRVSHRICSHPSSFFIHTVCPASLLHSDMGFRVVTLVIRNSN